MGKGLKVGFVTFQLQHSLQEQLGWRQGRLRGFRQCWHHWTLRTRQCSRGKGQSNHCNHHRDTQQGRHSQGRHSQGHRYHRHQHLQRRKQRDKPRKLLEGRNKIFIGTEWFLPQEQSCSSFYVESTWYIDNPATGGSFYRRLLMWTVPVLAGGVMRCSQTSWKSDGLWWHLPSLCIVYLPVISHTSYLTKEIKWNLWINIFFKSIKCLHILTFQGEKMILTKNVPCHPFHFLKSGNHN